MVPGRNEIAGKGDHPILCVDEDALLSGSMTRDRFHAKAGEEFGLASSYPRKEFGRELRGSSLSELGLHPSSTLFTRELSDSD